MLMQIDGTFIFVVISFIIFFFIIKSLLFVPISQIIEQREQFYAQKTQEQKDFKDKTKALIDEKESTIQETRNKASNILKEISKNTTDENEARINRIKKNAYVRVEENQQDLENQKSEVKQEVKSELEDIVKAMASKVVGEEIEISLEEEKIKQYLNI